jgi:hypothetical protein
MPGTDATVLDHVLAFLIPLFLRGAGDDQASARGAAIHLLDSYGAATGEDLLLAAEIIAFSFTTLDNLGRSVADSDLSISARLRLRSNANALSRAAERNRRNLQRSKMPDPLSAASPARSTAPSPAAPSPTATSPTPPSALQKVRDAIVEAAPALAETLANATQPMSRQQRRFLMRKADQARAAQEREARKTARLAPRATAAA